MSSVLARNGWRASWNASFVCSRSSTAVALPSAAGFEVDYLALVDGPSLAPLACESSRAGARLIVAARLGSVRLIDNIAAL